MMQSVPFPCGRDVWVWPIATDLICRDVVRPQRQTGLDSLAASITALTQTDVVAPALRRDVLLPKVRDIKSQGLSYVIRG
jgi:hypothetical protein